MVKKSAGKAAPAPVTKATKPTKKAAKSAPIAKPTITAKEDTSDSDSDSSAAVEEEEDSDAEGQEDNKEAEGGRTMEEKIQDMNSKTSSTSTTTSHPTSTTSLSRTTAAPTTPTPNKYTTPKANDLQQTLLQALHASDADLLDACLHFSHPVTALRNTIRRVATAYITPLLTNILNQYQQKPNQNAHLIEWIKAILLIHSHFLMSNFELVKRLSVFYEAIDARVPVHQKVMNLNGRLDLIMNQIEMRKQYEQGQGEDEVVYVEDEEQQVEEDEDLDHAGGAMDDDEDDDDDLVGEADAFDDENGDTDEEELESDMSEDDDEVSDDEE
ncbi:WD repeat-containing protein 43 [Linnemannia gamsii]|uniref:WD repeat-containing protein 43 n=1 Tax=Linnemannia gamsii TaxID=64522 RepID=A0ABQ7JN61_9FUNG|nr:WD repeat-containing protein 43 [Linnemannia gamsii]